MEEKLKRHHNSDSVSITARNIARQTGRKRRDVERELRGREHQRFMRVFSYALIMALVIYVAGLATAISNSG